jgi:uncharacterized delta-60 repeat protein
MKKSILLLLILQCSLSSISFGQQPGDLDNSFGTGGKVVKYLAPWLDIAIQPDGKILAVSNVLARYKTDGSLDSSFAINGIDTIKIGSAIYKCSAVSLQPDGKILVTGRPAYGTSTLKDFFLIRYHTDGSHDSSFDGDGVLLTDLNSTSNDYGYELAIQQDGKIIVAGASNNYLALCRYHSDGSLDSSFDYDGKLVDYSVNVNFGGNWSDAVYMKLQTDGKILVGSGMVITRLKNDGSVDSSFGTSGVNILASSMYDIIIQPDDKIVLAGGGTAFVITRLNYDGSPDNNFGNGGVTTTGWYPLTCSHPTQIATSVVLQPDGRILAGGYNTCGILNDGREFVLIRYNDNGSIDSSFNADGKVTTSFLGFSSESHASVITPDLKLILGGFSYYIDYGALARYHLGYMLDVNTVAGTMENIGIAPNPTQDWINIQASKIENGIWHLEVLDLAGRQVMQEEIAVTSGSIQKKVFLNGLPAGLYLLQLDNGKKKAVSRVVKYE